MLQRMAVALPAQHAALLVPGAEHDALRRQAVERGLLPAAEAAALSDRDALNLIFVPGFSTAAAVTRTSGRGVGLDVVRTNVSRLNGEIHVETEPGRMTRFVLKLPLTVAIADALMVRCGAEIFALPLTAVSVMRSVASSEIVSAGSRETVRLDDQVIDLVRLDRVLGEPAAHRVHLAIREKQSGGAGRSVRPKRPNESQVILDLMDTPCPFRQRDRIGQQQAPAVSRVAVTARNPGQEGQQGRFERILKQNRQVEPQTV